MIELGATLVAALPGLAAIAAGAVRWRADRGARRTWRRTPPLARVALIALGALALASCHTTHRGHWATGPVPQTLLSFQEPVRYADGTEVPSQNGLLASYFAGARYDRLDHQQIDPTVDFFWDAVADGPVTTPDATDTDEGCGGFCGLPPSWHHWSVVWEGYVAADLEGAYVLGIHVNNGGWLEMKDPATGSLITVAAAPGGPSFEGDGLSAALALGRGRHYIRFSFFQNSPPVGVAQLLWQPPGATGLTVIPSSALFTQATPPAASDEVSDELGASFGGDPTVGALIAEPVNTLTGNLSLVQVDLAIPGRGPPLRLLRAYNARDPRVTALGSGWSSDLGWRLRERAGGDAVVFRPDGRRDVFRRNADGTYAPPSGVFDELGRRDGGGFELRTPDQLSVLFSADGLLTGIADRNGNALTYTLDESARIAQIDASGGRSLFFEYSAEGRLARASDSAGRAVAYAYSDGRLAAVTDAAGGVTRYAYDAAGRLATVTDPRGVVVLTNAYDADGRVLEQRDGLEARTTFAYLADRVTTSTGPRGTTTRIVHDPAGRATLLTDASARTVTYAFDARGGLVGSTDRNGNAWRFSVDARGNRTGVTDPAGASASFTFDVRNDLLTRTDPLGDTWRYEYDARGNLVRTTDPEGAVTVVDVDAFGQPTRITDADGVAVAYAYDAAGNVTTVTTAAGTATTAYDAAGRPVRRTDANAHATAFGYDAAGRLTSVTDPLGASSALAYDAAGSLTRTTDRRGADTDFAYDAGGRLVRIADALGGITAFAYDAAGNRTAITDPAGKATRFGYDALERLASVTDPEGGTSRFAYDPNGNLVRTTDPRGGVTRHEYDFRNQRVRTLERTGAPTSYAYDNAGRLVSATDPAGATTTFAYDRAGRSTRTADALGGITALAYSGAGRLGSRTDPRGGSTAFAYDASGRLASLTDALGGITGYAYDAAGNRISRTDALGRRTTSAYDAADRLVALTDAAGSTTRYAYDAEGALTVRTDPLGAATRYSYDPLGRLDAVTDALGGVTRYELDARGLVTALTDANGHGRAYAYDGARRLVREADALGRARGYAYDASGNLTLATDAKGQATRYAYDAEDRLVETSRADGELVRYGRDPRGLRTLMTDGRGTTAYAYDALRRPTQVTDARGARVGYGYDANGNRTRLEYPDARAAEYTYDALDRLTAVGFAGGITRYSYDAVGNAVAAAFANGTRLSATYDALDRPTALAYADARGRPAASFTYAYDAAGNVVRETADGARDLRDDRLYGYDALRRLASVTDRDKKATTYRYDAVGNRTATLREGKLQEQATYDPADQLTALLRADGKVDTALSYDASGNLTEHRRGDAVTTYGYDAADRLTAFTEKDRRSLFAYDGDGALVREQQLGLDDLTTRALEHTLDVVGPLTQVLQTSDGREGAAYLYGLGRLAAVGPKETRFFAADVRGSPRLLTDGKGQVAGVRGFDAWGVPNTDGSVANASGPAALAELFGFTGERQDARSGLVHLRARWYDPASGRFLSRDPVLGARSDPRTQHPYMYGLDDPVGHLDRSGRSASGLFDGASGYSYDATALYAAYPAPASFGGPPNAAPVRARETGGGGPLQYAAQVGGGFLKGAWNTVTGIGQVAQGAWNSAAACAYDRSACDAQWQANRELGSAVQTLGFPGTAGAIWDAATANCGAALATGAGEAVGGCGFDVISTVVGTKGVDKLGKLSKLRLAARGAEATPASTETARLATRVGDLHQVLDPIAQTRRTTAVLSTREGRDVLAGGVRDLSPAQRAVTGESDVIGRLPGGHAEVTALKAAREAGLTPREIATSTNICPTCRMVLEEAGAIVTGPRSALWPQ